MTWWTSIVTEGWSIAGDLLTQMWPVAAFPVAFGIGAFIWGMVLSLRG